MSPEFRLHIVEWIGRYLSGDISLVDDILKRHDAINDTTSVACVATVSNNLLNRKRNLDMEVDEFEFHKRRDTWMVDLRAKVAGVQHLELDARYKQADVEEKELGVKYKRIKLDREAIALAEQHKEDIHLYTAIKEAIVNGELFPKREEEPEKEPAEDYLKNKDLTMLIAEMGYPRQTNAVKSKLGSAISKKYREKYGTKPAATKKIVDGAFRSVNVYAQKDYQWIKDIIRSSLGVVRRGRSK